MDENKLFDMLDKIYVEVQANTSRLDKVDSRLDKVDSILDKVDNRLDKVDSRLDKADGRFDILENGVKNNSIILEATQSDIKTMSEIQKSSIVQNVKENIELVMPIKESIYVIELAVKSISKEVHELRDNFGKVEKVTIQNTYDVAYLKAAK